MQDKQKVTLYLPPDLHRKLKIRSAVDGEAMSAIAERAIVFFLTHSDVVDGVERSYGHTHQIYECPECSAALSMRNSDLIALSSDRPGVDTSEEIQVGAVQDHLVPNACHPEEGELVPC
ncbi:MAG: hypothetical protein QNJ46_33315 [Leptolyngbyaceae cyanobacterium MO_188.B28]|nr:hypothetical protein [Leptolyngbyaceae cyanobacterium MO_188.B28]